MPTVNIALHCAPPQRLEFIVHPDKVSPIDRPVDKTQYWLGVPAADEVYLKGEAPHGE